MIIGVRQALTPRGLKCGMCGGITGKGYHVMQVRLFNDNGNVCKECTRKMLQDLELHDHITRKSTV